MRPGMKIQRSLFPAPRRPRRPRIPAVKQSTSPLQFAERRGYIQGRANKHDEPKYDFPLPGQWSAWFRGWRRGQKEFKRDRAMRGQTW